MNKIRELKAEEAVSRFLGKNGRKRMNCAEAVASLFENAGVFSDDDSAVFKKSSAGLAPGGYCGSAFAAITALKKFDSDREEDFKAVFTAAAGSLKCGEVRKNRKLSCAKCVKLSAEYVIEAFNNKHSSDESPLDAPTGG